MKLLKYYTLFLLSVLTSVNLSADSGTITGRVYGVDSKGKKSALPGATVYFTAQSGALTDSDGKFAIGKPANKDMYLKAAFLGFAIDSILISNDRTVDFILKESGEQLSEAVIIGRQQGTYISMIGPLKTEVISKAGLLKMACCNLSESFENSATVTVGFTDAVSGAKQVQLLGLSGIYTQMLDENVPTLRGLASTYGWSYTPGPWLESIQISKGASSVQNGYESVTGQINLEFKKPNHTEPLFINLFADGAGRYEGNLIASTNVNEKLSTGLFLHASTESKEHDNNKDGFLDMPKTKLINIYNRWLYENHEKETESRTGIKFLYETREGGQLSSIPDGYKTDIVNKNLNIYNKTGFGVGREGQSIGLINSFTYHNQNSRFGHKNFAGEQLTFHGNYLFSSYFGNTAHKYVTGLGLNYDNYRTDFRDDAVYNNTPLTALNREEIVPGAFFQYTYSYSEKFIFIAGIRTDYNSRFGWLFTPRSNLKYSIIDDVVLRLSAGRGFRSPDVIAENVGLMASARKFDLSNINNLGIEKAWNYGANISVGIPMYDERKMTLSFDYFRTEFQNQAVADIERTGNDVYFYNLKGKSFADVWQADLTFNPLKGLELFAAFRYNDTQITYTGEDGVNHTVEKPLLSRYRGLINLSYATNFKKWVFDATAQINGPARIPSLTGYASESDYSPSFPVYFAQITKNGKRFDIYVGLENIGDYKQSNPIINHDKPFERGFDSSLIWGPLMGRKIYGGIRLRIGQL